MRQPCTKFCFVSKSPVASPVDRTVDGGKTMLQYWSEDPKVGHNMVVVHNSLKIHGSLGRFGWLYVIIFNAPGKLSHRIHIIEYKPLWKVIPCVYEVFLCVSVSLCQTLFCGCGSCLPILSISFHTYRSCVYFKSVPCSCASAVIGFCRKVSYTDIAVLLTSRYMTIGLRGRSSTLPVALNFWTSFVMVLCLCKEKLKLLLIMLWI